MAIKRVTFTIEESLLDSFDSFADANGISRSALITIATKKYIEANQKAPDSKAALSEFFQILSDAAKGDVSKDALNARIDSLDAIVKSLQA